MGPVYCVVLVHLGQVKKKIVIVEVTLVNHCFSPDRARTCELPFDDRVPRVIVSVLISTCLKSTLYRLLHAHLCLLVGATPEETDPWRHFYTAVLSTITGLLWPVLNQLNWETVRENVEVALFSINGSPIQSDP